MPHFFLSRDFHNVGIDVSTLSSIHDEWARRRVFRSEKDGTLISDSIISHVTEASYLTSLNLGFSICETEAIIITK